MANNIGIPADVIEEILLRLPVKTLLRLKSVCSGWFSLIGSRSFGERHYLRQEEWQVVVDPGSNADEYYEKVGSWPYILGPAKGVFCEVREDATLILWNPATREIKTVPPVPDPILMSPYLYACRHDLVYGFGLDPLSGAYKMVAFLKSSSKHDPVACVVYNSTSNSWKHLSNEGLARMLHAMPGARWSHRQSRFLNGVYYWLLRSYNGCGFGILAFDMASEEFREVKAVPERGRSRLGIWRPSLAVYRGSLALMSVLVLGECECVELWVMVGEVWVYRFSWGPFQDMAWQRCLWNITHRHDLFLETLRFYHQIPTQLAAETKSVSGITHLRPSDSDPLHALLPYKESLSLLNYK